MLLGAKKSTRFQSTSDPVIDLGRCPFQHFPSRRTREIPAHVRPDPKLIRHSQCSLRISDWLDNLIVIIKRIIGGPEFRESKCR